MYTLKESTQAELNRVQAIIKKELASEKIIPVPDAPIIISKILILNNVNLIQFFFIFFRINNLLQFYN